MKDVKIKMVCDKCGKPMPVDNEKSNQNWVVYKNECHCGGKGKLDMQHMAKF